MTSIDGGSFLVAVSEYGEFSAMMSLCREVEGALGLHPVFVFCARYGMVQEHGQLVVQQRWSWVQLGGGRNARSYRSGHDVSSGDGYFRVDSRAAGTAGQQRGKDPGAGRYFLKAGLAALYAGRLAARRFGRSAVLRGSRAALSAGYLRPASQIGAELASARRIFADVRPRLVLSGQDYALSVTAILAKVGEERGVRTAIVPYSMPPTTRELIETFSYSGYNRLHGFELRAADLIDPRWLNLHRGKVYARVNIPFAMASDRMGLTPPEPWLPNSGRGVVLAPSRHGYEYYLKAGIPEAQLRLTGAVWSDTLVRASATVAERKLRLLKNLRAMLKAKSGGGSKLVIVSWPPNQWPRKAMGCATYADLCHQFIAMMRGLQRSRIATVAVSLHPTTTQPDLVRAINAADIHILPSRLVEYIDCADVFVSTVSSTNFWALQCGIPTINYDGYLYGYTEFDEAGALTVKSAQEIYDVCERLISDDALLAETTGRIRRQSEAFGMSDGCSMERILAELASLAGSRDASAR
jgi:hypothetical protein